MRERFLHKLLTVVVLGAMSLASAQHDKCLNTYWEEQEIKNNPQYLQYREQLESFTQSYSATHKNNKSDSLRIIPVVFHVIYDNATNNIPDADILDCLQRLNADFANTNFDRPNRPPYFDSVSADCKLEFRLARKDPAGNCTQGITRTFSAATNNAYDNVKSIISWNGAHYLNIWVVNNIAKDGDPSQIVLGYATFPSTTADSKQGIVIRADNVGGIRGRTLTHEVGHWLNLRHIWGDSECGSDLVEDTPPHTGPNFDNNVCFTHPKITGSRNALGQATTQGPPCPELDLRTGEMFENYMDYSSDKCLNMFTQGQKLRMDAALAGPRLHLHLYSNLVRTGLIDPQPCAPIATISTNRKMICAGSTVQFKDFSYNGTVDSRNWNFEGGNPATSTLATQTVTYANAGTYDVSLTATNAQGNSTSALTDYVIVSPTAGASGSAFQQGFESPSSFSDWLTFNNENDAVKWEYFSGTGHATRNGCLRINNVNGVTGYTDELISPAYDLTQITSPKLSFSYSGATKLPPVNFTDPTGQNILYKGYSLKVQYSKDCGATWVDISSANYPNTQTASTYFNTNIVNMGQRADAFVPAPGIPEWRNMIVNIPSAAASGNNVRFKFTFKGSSDDNNFYLDDINIGSNLVGLDEYEGVTNFNLYPNPTQGDVQITLTTTELKEVSIKVYDLVGRQVSTTATSQLGIGNHNLNLNLNNLNNGVYVAHIQIGNSTIIRKIDLNK